MRNVGTTGVLSAESELHRMFVSKRVHLLIFFVSIACTSSGGGNQSEGGSTESTGDPAETSESSSGSSSSSTAPEESSSTGPASVCGNGIVEGEEDCDGEGPCRSDCRSPCGVAATVIVPVDFSVNRLALAFDADGLVVIAGTEESEDLALRVARLDGDVVVDDWRVDDDGDDFTLALALVDGTLPVVLATQATHEDEIVLFGFTDAGPEPWGGTPIALPDTEIDVTALANAGEGAVAVSGRIGFGTGNFDAWIGRIDAEGSLTPFVYDSSSTPEDPNNDKSGPLVVDDAGAIYLAGLQRSVESTAIVDDLAVVKFPPEATAPEWTHVEFLRSTNVDVFPVGISTHPQGGVAVLYQLAHASNDDLHFVLERLDESGELAFRVDSVDALDHAFFAQQLAVDASGNQFVIGENIDENTISLDVIAFSPAGELRCHESVGITETVHDGALTPNGELVLVTVNDANGTVRLHTIAGFEES